MEIAHVVARFKRAAWQGPFAWVEPKQLLVWIPFAGVGRVHQIVADLNQVENTLEKIRAKLVQNFSNLEQHVDPSDVYVRPTSDQMQAEFYFSNRGEPWSDSDIEAIQDLCSKAGVVSIKKP